MQNTKIQDLLRASIPHAVAITAFIAINLVLFSPMIFENKSLNQNDILQGAGANQEIIDYRAETGEEALWTNGMFSGMPAYLINVYWSGDKSNILYQLLSAGLPSPASRVFIAMLSFYLLLIVMGVNPYLAIAGGVTYGLNSFFMIGVEAGHMWKVAAIGLMPLVLAGIELTFRKKYVWGFILTAVAMTLQIRANHYQITYYLLILVIIYGIFKLFYAFQDKSLPSFFKNIVILVAAVVIAVGVNFGKLWAAYEYGTFSIRGPSELSSNTQSTSGGLDRDYAFAWSNGIWETMTFFIPNFYGGASQEALSGESTLAEGLRAQNIGPAQINNFIKSVPTYWGDQPFTSGPYYLGATCLLLFVLGLVLVEGSRKWWIVVAAVFAIMLSWGDNFANLNYLLFDYLPGYNKFRAVSNIIAVPFLCIPLLGFLGLDKLLTMDRKKALKSFLISALSALGILIAVLLASTMMSYAGAVDSQLAGNDFLVGLIRDQRKSMLISDTFRSLVLIALLSAAIYFYLRKKVKENYLVAFMVILVTVDVYNVSNRYLNEENYVRSLRKSYFQLSAADQTIDNSKPMHARVLNLNNPFNEAKTSYFHASIGGYHGAKLRRYQDLIDYYLQAELAEIVQALQDGRFPFSNTPVLNMLNMRFAKFGDAANQVIENANAYGNAWFVQNVTTVNSPDDAINSLGSVNLKTTAIVNSEEFDVDTVGGGQGQIELVEYAPNYLKYESSVQKAGLAVFSEIYYPIGWTAFIDGQESPIMRANYVLRALSLPTGNHVIELKFEPDAYLIGNKIMLFSSILLYLSLLLGLYQLWQLRK